MRRILSTVLLGGLALSACNSGEQQPAANQTSIKVRSNEQEQLKKLSAGKEIPDFGPGDTIIVNVKVVEGERTRVQAYEGVCIGRSGQGLNESFTVRKISYGEGVERVFPVMSPMIDSIKVVRRGKVRRAKLYYLRNLRGKSARIVEKQDRQTAVGE